MLPYHPAKRLCVSLSTPSHLQKATLRIQRPSPARPTAHARPSSAKGDELHGAEDGSINFHRAEEELRRRIRNVGWQKRKGNAYIDRAIVTLQGGKGGDGCVSFYHAPFSPENTPPDGAGGGRGGNVYLRVTDTVRSIGHLASHYVAGTGTTGRGDNRTGERGRDLVIDVPPGTTVVERRSPKDWPPTSADGEEPPLEADWDAYSEWEVARRNRIFVFYPGLRGDATTPTPEDERFFRAEAEHLLYERTQRRLELSRRPIELDLVEQEGDPVLVAMGGEGGRGNSTFVGGYCRLPKFGTRGQPGQSVTLQLEIKTLADVAFVGFPNSGKSTLLRTMSNSQAEIAPYAFTTLAPHVATVICYEDGSFGDGATDVIEESPSYSSDYGARESEVEDTTRLADERYETFRMTIADCPGILPDASSNVGLGHDFLRHIERAPVLAYVLDLSSSDPLSTFTSLRDELETYRPDLSNRAAVIILNKADQVSESEARSRLTALKSSISSDLPLLPISAKHRHNIPRLVRTLRTAVETSRLAREEKEPDRTAARRERVEEEHRALLERTMVTRRAGGIDYRVHATPADRKAAQAIYDTGLKRAKIEDARWMAELGERRRERVARESERKKVEWDERRRERRGLASEGMEMDVDRDAEAYAKQQSSI